MGGGGESDPECNTAPADAYRGQAHRRRQRSTRTSAVTFGRLVTLWLIPQEHLVELKADRHKHDERDLSHEKDLTVVSGRGPRRDTQD